MDNVSHLTRFGGVLIQRIVHDLAGAAGALEGAVELAATDPEIAADALDVARETAAVLSARLRLLRAAWLPSGEPIDAAGIARLWVGLPGASRLTHRLDGLTDAVPPDRVPALLHAIAVAAEGLPRGGTITVSGDVVGLSVAIDGAGGGWPAGFAGLLADATAAHAALLAAEPATLTAAACAAIVHRDGVRASLESDTIFRLVWA